MDWASHIETNRQKLIGIVAALMALVGLPGAAAAHRIGWALRLEILHTLRPAEAAVKRLIVMAARGLVLKPAVSRAMPPGLSRQLRLRRKQHPARPVFQLSDPLVPMAEPFHRKYSRQGPRISMVPPLDPTVTAIWQALAPKVSTPPDTSVKDSAALTRRLEAIQSALADVPRQARRLVRWRTRRETIAAQRPIHCSPLRAGPAPYLPKPPQRDVDFILERCHLLARDALRADTS